MVELAQDQGLAPKTFFIAPDPSIISEEFLQSAFFMGYESYSVPHDLGGKIDRKVGVVIDTFPETLVFFTIDRKGDLKSWGEFLGALQAQFPEKSRIGVLYNRPESASMDQKIKDMFLLEIGITGGCIPLHYSVSKNHSLLLNVLAANQAQGRRKLIRLNCGPSFKINFLQDDQKVEGILIDLSISHFSASFEGTDPQWEIGTKVKNVQLCLTGMLLMVNVIVVIRRISRGKPTYVFFFRTEDASPGLDDLLKMKVNQFIYQKFQNHTMGILDDRFGQAGQNAVRRNE